MADPKNLEIIQKGQPLGVTLGIMALTLLATGVVVGAVHGPALVMLACMPAR